MRQESVTDDARQQPLLAEGTVEDLRREENVKGYARCLDHSEISRGMNDYDGIFKALRDVGFDGDISIEDGVNGIDQPERSISFTCLNID